MNISFAKYLAALSVLAVPVAHASTYTFDGSFGGGVGNVDLQFVTDGVINGFGGNDITSISGTLAGFGNIDQLVTSGFVAPESNVTIGYNSSAGYTAVIAAGTGLNLNGDNTFFAGSGANFDAANGILFHLTNGDYVNIFANGSNYELAVGSPSVGAGTYPLVVDTVGSATVAPVPLPATAALLLSGLGGMGLFARKRKNA